MIATESPRIGALKKVFAAYRADSSPLVAKAYLQGLEDVPEDILVKAIDAAILGEAFMPTVARIRTYADKVRPILPELPAPTVEPSHYLAGEVAPLEDTDPRLWVHCSHCKDTGWLESVREQKPPYTMPVAVGKTIERRVIEVERRSYFSHCMCRASNPKLQADRQRRVKYSRENE